MKKNKITGSTIANNNKLEAWILYGLLVRQSLQKKPQKPKYYQKPQKKKKKKKSVNLKNAKQLIHLVSNIKLKLKQFFFFFFYGIGKIWNKDKDRRRTIFEFVLILLLVFGWVAQLGNEREGALWDFVRGFICNIYNKRSFFWMALVVASTWRSSLGRPISFRSLSMMSTCRRPYWRAVFFPFCNGHSGVWSLHGSRPKTRALKPIVSTNI